MKCINRIGEYVRFLKASPGLGRQVVFHKEVAATKACFNSPAGPWPDEMQVLLKGCGILRLYSHQVSAIDKVDYFTRVRSNKTTEILEVFGKKGYMGPVCLLDDSGSQTGSPGMREGM